MGLFDMFKKKKVEEVKVETSDEYADEAPGWDAISEAFEEIYPEDKYPSSHFGTMIPWKMGGNDPLDGIDVYDVGEYWHFVTYGLSELFEKETDNEEISGFGMEFTFKLKKEAYEDIEGEKRCICGILQAIARMTFTQKEIFAPFEYLYTGQTQGIDSKAQSNITGFITIPDTAVASIDTPNGKVNFVEFIGVTNAELQAILNKEMDVKTLYEKLGTDVTNYNRSSVV